MCFPTGFSQIAIELKKCKDTVTAYMGFPVTNKIFKSAISNGARARPVTPIFFFILFLKKLLP